MIENIAFGIWNIDDRKEKKAEKYSYNVQLKTGFVCKVCQQSVLAYKQPKKCEDHN